MKRTTVLIVGGVLAFVLSGCGGVDKSKLEPVYRSAKAVEASTTAGVTYEQFLPLVQAFTTEISIARDKPLNDRERMLLDHYTKAATIYQDSARAWRSLSPEIATKYGLPRGADIPQDMWAQAVVWLHAGHDLYNGTRSAS